MTTTCKVIGWSLDGSDKGQILLREANGDSATRTTSLADTFGQLAIQTGSFRRGDPIIDPVTRKTLGYEMQPL